MSGTMSIGGLASGLDTNNIIAQLMDIERAPIDQWLNRQAKLKRVDEAWSTIVSKLSAVRTAMNNIADPTDWSGLSKVTSSDKTILDAAVQGTATPGSVTLKVEALAYAQQRVSAENFSGTDATMGTRQLTITTSSGAYVITPDSPDTTLAEFVEKINKSDAEVRAQAVEVTPGDFELVITAESTGTANGFTVTPANWTGGWAETQAAADSQIRIGDPVSGLLLTRSSNTVSDIIEGVTLSLKQVSATSVTISTERNVDLAATKVERWVAEMNGLLQAAKDLSSYNADKKVAQPLVSDPTLRGLVSTVINGITDTLTGLTGDYTTAASVGIESTKDGLLTIDSAKLREALTDNFDGVSSLFIRAGSVTDTRLNYVTATDDTQAGTYNVVITAAARKAEITGAAFAASAETLTITSGGESADVVLDGTETLAQAVVKISDALEAEGITSVTVEESGGAIRLVDAAYGTASTFTVTSTGGGFGLSGTHTGQDVAGTIDGVAGTGKGQTLTIDTDDATVDGLVVRVRATQAEVDAAAGSLALGTITVAQGLAGRMSAQISQFEGTAGHIQRTRDGIENDRTLLDERIDRLEVRLKTKEASLVRIFSTMESAMGRLTAQGNWLAAQLASLSR